MRAGERNYAIDALRFVAICLVVYIHIFGFNPGVAFADTFSWKVIDLLFGLARLAVPVFFAISGWFIFSANREEQLGRLQKQVPKLLKILVVAIISSSAVLWTLFRLNLLINAVAYFPQIRNIFEAFIFGKAPNADGPLWFLVTLILVEIIFWLATRAWKNDIWLAVLASVFFLLSLCYGAYRSISGFSPLPSIINENTWFVGFMWFSLGYFLAKIFKDKPQAIKIRALRTFTICAGAFYFYEYIMHTSGAPFHFGPYNYNAIFMFTPFITAGLLLMAARMKNDGKLIRLLASWGRNYTLGVFIIHYPVMQPIAVLFNKVNLFNGHLLIKLGIMYVLVVTISFGLTFLYYALKSRLATYTARPR